MIRLTNSATRKKDDFRPLDPGNVRMYVCGPTVYDRAHLGNARPAVVFDVLYRLLRHTYGEGAVTYVRNITDVDDKINARAAETGRPIREITEETVRWYHEDMRALGVLPPTHEPRATDWVPQMVAMIEGLIAKGHAYAADGHVLFRVRSYAGYGALSGRSVDDMIAGARVDVAPYKEDPMDFVLWKPSDASLPGWESPWGRGRPGWHIECSAMAKALLGERFDIHAGGLDLQFPHHENEIAQSVCAHGGHGPADFAQVWLHNEMLLVEGKKMSKSLGNFFTVRELLDKGWPGEVIRFVLLSTHYRSPMDWTEEKARQAKETLKRWRNHARLVGFGDRGEGVINAAVVPGLVDALGDDLNTHLALSLLGRFEKDRLRAAQVELDDVAVFSRSLRLVGLDGLSSDTVSVPDDVAASFRQARLIEAVSARIDAARARRDFAESDRVRAALIGAGYQVHSTPTGTAISAPEGSDLSVLEALQ
jgi:cysteinyl-tRNA synthetase